MKNVVTAIFETESEAYQAFHEISETPFGTGYIVAEVALVKHEGDNVRLVNLYDAANIGADDTEAGVLVGTLIGILGGPIGMLLGASIGGLAGSAVDANDAQVGLSGLEVTANKLYENETAIIAFVQEDEPAFDAAFEKYNTTIYRKDADRVSDEIDRAKELEKQLAKEAKAQLRAEKKAKKAEKEAEKAAKKEAKRSARQAKMDAKFDELEAKMAEKAEKKAAKKAEMEAEIKAFDEAADIAHDEFVAETKKMTGEE